ncbi:DUF6415 family natural product biosynthesis protein [Streptomyces sp. NPDC001667]
MPSTNPAPASHFYAARIDNPDDSAPVDVDGIQQTVAVALAPLPSGAHLVPEALQTTARLLTGHAQLLLPLAEAKNRVRRPAPRGPGLVGYGLAHVRHQLEKVPCPDPEAEPEAALVWVQEMARHCQMLLGLSLADDREHQHAAAR